MIERTQSLRILFSPAYSQPPESVRKLSLTQGQKIQYGALANSVSDPYSLNPDPAKNLNQDPEKALNPDPDPSYFFTLSDEKLEVIKKKNYVMII